MRAAAILACEMLISCSGGGSDGASSPPPAAKPAAAVVPTVGIALAPTGVATGQASMLTWSSTDAVSCAASGAWTGVKETAGSVAVSQAGVGTNIYSLTCTGAGGNATGAATLATTAAAGNAVPVFIERGAAGGNSLNVPFVSVTVCRPGTSACQSIERVLLDTGSYGLRLIAPGVLDASLALPEVLNARAERVGECAQFVSGFTWGSIHQADVKLAGETAAALPIQIIGDPAAEFTAIPADCSSTGANIGTVAALGANGILGVGLFNHDCGAACVTRVVPGTYYGCTATGCTGTELPLASQVANPVAGFVTNNNGVVLVVPPVPNGGATTLTGTLIFGIGTQTNNQLGSATVYAANSRGNFTTTYKGVTLNSSFLDSGSNALFFPDATIPVCVPSSSFYCPATTLSLSAVNSSFNGSVSRPISFTIENPQLLPRSIKAASIGGGTAGTGIRGFDFGLPFFFGRTVFVALSSGGTGPYWAY